MSQLELFFFSISSHKEGLKQDGPV